MLILISFVSDDQTYVGPLWHFSTTLSAILPLQFCLQRFSVSNFFHAFIFLSHPFAASRINFCGCGLYVWARQSSRVYGSYGKPFD